ncbi:MAG TPA: hypothetical protein DDX06_14620 [Curvibacter sp.]|nr:hypothetical protein [Curvibacter sp.]|tara:strand:+ start:488 stop:739 length:252 start_codon:yes stop_codon:yes gene_type:complete
MTAILTDQEREQHIAACGRLMLEAMAEGRRADAEAWLQAQGDAIRGRSPEQITRMEVERGLAPCYFHDQGERDAQAMLGRQAA